MTVIDCPECRQGKHINCTGEVLTDDDTWTGCPCKNRDHRSCEAYVDRQLSFKAGQPITPYAGSSGHSGSETSKARADKDDSDGSTATRQSRIGALVQERGYQGATWKEIRVVFPQWHHGQISSALSTLHKVGALSCLTASREGCAVYVGSTYVRDRETREQGARQAYPRKSGDVTVIGPECFISEDESVICYKGTNYRRSNDEH